MQSGLTLNHCVKETLRLARRLMLGVFTRPQPWWPMLSQLKGSTFEEEDVWRSARLARWPRPAVQTGARVAAPAAPAMVFMKPRRVTGDVETAFAVFLISITPLASLGEGHRG